MEAATSVGGPEVPRALARGTFGVQGEGYVVVGGSRLSGPLRFSRVVGCRQCYTPRAVIPRTARGVSQSPPKSPRQWIPVDLGCGVAHFSDFPRSVMGE